MAADLFGELQAARYLEALKARASGGDTGRWKVRRRRICRREAVRSGLEGDQVLPTRSTQDRLRCWQGLTRPRGALLPMVNRATAPVEVRSLRREAEEGSRVQGLVVTSLEGKTKPR